MKKKYNTEIFITRAERAACGRSIAGGSCVRLYVLLRTKMKQGDVCVP